MAVWEKEFGPFWEAASDAWVGSLDGVSKRGEREALKRAGGVSGVSIDWSNIGHYRSPARRLGAEARGRGDLPARGSDWKNIFLMELSISKRCSL